MIEFRIPMKAPSTPNLREHHMAKAKRVKSQRGAVQRKMPKWPLGPQIIVRLTRVSPRELDSDNLQGAFKAIRDQVAAGLLVDDRSPLVAWEYHQAKGEPEVVVQIWKAGEDAPPLPTGGKAEARKTRGRDTKEERIPDQVLRRLGMKTGLRASLKRLSPASTVKAARQPSANYTPPEAANMRSAAMRAAARSIAQAMDLPAVREVPSASRTNRMATKAMEPSNAAEHRALLAAQEVEETFAPGPDEPETCRVPECDEKRVAHGYCAVHALQGDP